MVKMRHRIATLLIIFAMFTCGGCFGCAANGPGYSTHMGDKH